MRQTTIGEYRVGITFNPSGDDTVAKIKTAAAALIDLIDGMKAATKPERQDDTIRA